MCCGSLLALHLPCLPAAQREGDRARGAATGHGMEEEPDGGQTLQVLPTSRLLPTRVLSFQCSEDRVTSGDRLAEVSLSSSLSCLTPFPFHSQPRGFSQGSFPIPYPKKCADTCFANVRSLYAFLP